MVIIVVGVFFFLLARWAWQSQGLNKFVRIKVLIPRNLQKTISNIFAECSEYLREVIGIEVKQQKCLLVCYNLFSFTILPFIDDNLNCVASDCFKSALIFF